MREWAGMLLALVTASCSAPYACKTDADTYAPDNLSAESLSGTVRLDAARSAAEVAFRATLTDLPQVWQASTNIIDGNVALRVSVEYEGEPKGNDGKTEMPRIAARLRDGSGGELTLETSSLAFGATSGTFQMLRTCSSSDDRNCCVYGDRSCSQRLSLALRRVDLAPFPAVVVSWRAEPSADVSPCPLESEVTAQLGFEQVAP